MVLPGTLTFFEAVLEQASHPSFLDVTCPSDVIPVVLRLPCAEFLPRVVAWC